MLCATKNMHSLLLRSQYNVHKSPSLQAFQAYRESEAHNSLQTSVSSDGELLEYETLELRVHPPNIDINNNHPTRSIITVDSANRPGTLIEVLSLSDVNERGCFNPTSYELWALEPGRPTLYRAWLGCSKGPNLVRRRLVRGW